MRRDELVVGYGKIVLMHDLRRQGLSVNAIARKRLTVDRKTVRKDLQRSVAEPVFGPRACGGRLADSCEDYLRER